jgi:hypothetical protein
MPKGVQGFVKGHKLTPHRKKDPVLAQVVKAELDSKPKGNDSQASIDRRMCQRSLYYLCKEVLGYKDFVPHVHGNMCHFATDPSFGRFRSACVPRSWFKTWTFTIAKAIWLTLPDEEKLYATIYPYKGPNVRILIASNVIDNAAKMVNKIKSEWQSNERLKSAFPELIPEFNKTRWSDHCAQVKRPGTYTEGTYTAVGVGGSVISQHFDHILEDDLVYAKKDDFTGSELMPSQEDIDNAIGWHKLVASLFTDPNTSCIDNTGTRWAPHDMIDHIRRNEAKDYSFFEVAVTKDAMWPVPDDSYCIWPERFGVKTLETIRNSQGARLFETQYLNRPRAGEDVTFNIAYVHKHAHVDDMPQGLKLLTFIDLASWGDGKRICNNVILTGGRDMRNHLWVYRVDAGKYNPTEVIEIAKQHVIQFGSKVMVEEVGYQVALRHFAMQDMESAGGFAYSINALPRDNRKGAKDLRIQALQPVIANGMFHVVDGMSMLMQELEDYPYASTKDIIDCVGYLHRYAQRPDGLREEEVRDPFSIDAIEAELRTKKTERRYPFDDPLDMDMAYGDTVEYN